MMTSRDKINSAAELYGWPVAAYGVRGTGQYHRPDGREMVTVVYSIRDAVTAAYRRPLTDGKPDSFDRKTASFFGAGRAQQVIDYFRKHSAHAHLRTDK